MGNRTATAALVSGLFLLISCSGTVDLTGTSTERLSTTTRAVSPSTTTPPPSLAETDDTRVCTLAGCDSVLTIELGQVDIISEATYGVEICVEGNCTLEEVTIDVPLPGTGEIVRGESHRGPTDRPPVDGFMLVWADGDYVEYYLPENEYGESAEVSFTLTDAGGDVLAQAEDEQVPLERADVNGPECPPVCFFGRMTI